jgi:hypothetical protein
MAAYWKHSTTYRKKSHLAPPSLSWGAGSELVEQPTDLIFIYLPQLPLATSQSQKFSNLTSFLALSLYPSITTEGLKDRLQEVPKGDKWSRRHFSLGKTCLHLKGIFRHQAMQK